MMRGGGIILPDGPEALIGPCDAEDIATLFALAVENRDAAAGELFNVGCEYSIPFTDCIRIYERLHGVKIPIKRVSLSEYTEKINPNPSDWWDYYADMCPNISKAKRLLGYSPKYTPEQAIKRAVDWMKEKGII